jgi:hypothetical protein
LKDWFDGYLYSLWDRLGGDVSTLQKVCAEHEYCAEVKAMLLIAQKVRYVPGETPTYSKPPQSQKDVLRQQASLVAQCFAECNLNEPTESEVRTALDRYKMFSEGEIDTMLAALD